MNGLHAKDMTLAIGNKTICHATNIEINCGDVWGLLGPNGSGKTTLLHALAGLHPTQHGCIFFNKRPLNTFSGKSLAQSIGILFQQHNSIFPQTVWEYCLASRFPHQAYFQRETQQDQSIIQQALTLMELTALQRRNINALSGGEKRRLAIAALLVQTPDIYLLDEPTNHLDVRHAMNALTHFHALAQSQAAGVMMALHDVNLAQRFCNRILLLFSDGTVQQGTPQKILTEANLTQLYRHPMTAIHQSSDVLFWQPALVV